MGEESALFRQPLKVGNHTNLGLREAVLNQLFLHKLARRNELIDALFVGAQPTVNVGFGRQHYGRTSSSRVAPLHNYLSETAAAAGFTSSSIGDQIVAGADQLEIVHVIDDRNALSLQFPQYRR